MKKVEVILEINVASNKIIQAFLQPEMLSEWWGVERSLIERRNGGIYTLAWQVSEKGFGYVTSGTIKNYEPDRLLEIENMIYLNPEKPIFGPMKLSVKAIKKDDRMLAYICQDGYQKGEDWDWYYNAVSDAWPKTAQTLKNYLERL